MGVAETSQAIEDINQTLTEIEIEIARLNGELTSAQEWRDQEWFKIDIYNAEGNYERTEYKIDFAEITDGTRMFENSTTTTQIGGFDNLTNGYYMFNGCTGLTTFTGTLDNLDNGMYMFRRCILSNFEPTDLTSLRFGRSMFESSANFTQWNVDTPALVYAQDMFYQSSLMECHGDMTALIYGQSMFNGSSNLYVFDSELPNLWYGSNMFYRCRLEKNSVCKILNSLQTYSSTAMQPVGYFNRDIKAPLIEQYNITVSPSGERSLTIGALRNDASGMLFIPGVPDPVSYSYQGCYTDGEVDAEVAQAIADAQAKGWTISITYY